MKTMRLGDDLPIRVKEKEVYEKLANGYNYCPKNIWKELVRPDKKEKEVKGKTKGNLKAKKEQE